MSGNPQAYLTAADFANELTALLPPGSAWNGSLLASLMIGAGEAFGTFHASAAQLTELEMVPATTNELLPDWEFDFGLPDCCSPLGDTTAQRIVALQAKMQALGGQSPPYFIGLAAALGFTVTITRYDVMRFGMPFGTPMYSEQWRFLWQVNVPTDATTAAELVCRISAYQPAAGRVVFAFAS